MYNDRKENPFRIIAKSYARYKKHGWSGMQQRLDKEYSQLGLSEINYLGKQSNYARWIEENEKDILDVKQLEYNPLISIVTPTYNTEKKYLIEMLESVLGQTYIHWELCIADDASYNKETISVLKEYSEKYENIKVLFRNSNGHISEASNSALSLARGDYVTFLDHDDTLAPNALYEMVKKLNENKKLKLIYSDEDKIDENSKRSNPHFKSGWNPDMLYSHNYICHLVMIQKKLVEKVNGFRKGYEGSQDYDLLLRISDLLQDYEIDRVEKILYHWRAIKGSTAYGSSEKEYAHISGLKALQDYFIHKNSAIKIDNGLLPNTYKVIYPLLKIPLVSIIIPTRNGYELLHKCIESILTKTLYSNYEIIIVDNETNCDKTLKYFEKLRKYENIKILQYHKTFNYSAINNYAVSQSNGEVIALLNNDIEVINETWLNEMVMHALREEIGAVGAKLYYADNTLQHAGVVLGIGGVAGHSHKYFSKNAYGYFSRLQIVQNYSAVTGACLVVRKKLFNEVDGLDEVNLTVAFNDVDFCLKLLEHGYRNVWTPYAKLYHYESKSRGSEDTPHKRKRFNQEVEYMQKRWLKYLKDDKSYNCNLTDKYENFNLNLQT